MGGSRRHGVGVFLVEMPYFTRREEMRLAHSCRRAPAKKTHFTSAVWGIAPFPALLHPSLRSENALDGRDRITEGMEAGWRKRSAVPFTTARLREVTRERHALFSNLTKILLIWRSTNAQFITD